MNTFTVTAPNGQVLSRKTKNTYSHACLVALRDGNYKAMHFSGNLAGAEKMAADDLRNYGWTTIIVAVNEVVA